MEQHPKLTIDGRQSGQGDQNTGQEKNKKRKRTPDGLILQDNSKKLDHLRKRFKPTHFQEPTTESPSPTDASPGTNIQTTEKLEPLRLPRIPERTVSLDVHKPYNDMPIPSELDLIPIQKWVTLPVEEKIQEENRAILKMIQERDKGYVQRITDGVHGKTRPMHPKTRVEIVAPVYNEQDNIPGLLESIAKQREVVDPNLWSVLFVINRPVFEKDVEKNKRDEDNMDKTKAILDKFKQDYPDLQINYVTARPEESRACVGLARTIGHDSAMIRSSERKMGDRTGTFYIQTMDGDTQLQDNYIGTIVKTIQSSEDRYDVVRQRGELPMIDKIHHPLLNPLKLVWNDTFSAIAKRIDNPWSLGGGMLLQTYSHAKVKGAFGIKLPAPDEDIRMGIYIRHYRDNTSVSEIPKPLFDSNPRREITIVESLKKALSDHPESFTREMQEIARTLRSYLKFEAFRDNPVYESTDASWLDTQERFEKAISPREVEVFLNSWWCTARTEYSMFLLKQSIPAVSDLYNEFARGTLAYPMLLQQFNALEAQLYRNDPSEQLVMGLQMASQWATMDMATIAGSHGIDVRTQVVSIEPPDMDPQTQLPRPLIVTSLSGYREELVKNYREYREELAKKGSG